MKGWEVTQVGRAYWCSSQKETVMIILLMRYHAITSLAPRSPDNNYIPDFRMVWINPLWIVEMNALIDLWSVPPTKIFHIPVLTLSKALGMASSIMYCYHGQRCTWTWVSLRQYLAGHSKWGCVACRYVFDGSTLRTWRFSTLTWKILFPTYLNSWKCMWRDQMRDIGSINRCRMRTVLSVSFLASFYFVAPLSDRRPFRLTFNGEFYKPLMGARAFNSRPIDEVWWWISTWVATVTFKGGLTFPWPAIGCEIEIKFDLKDWRVGIIKSVDAAIHSRNPMFADYHEVLVFKKVTLKELKKILQRK